MFISIPDPHNGQVGSGHRLRKSITSQWVRYLPTEGGGRKNQEGIQKYFTRLPSARPPCLLTSLVCKPSQPTRSTTRVTPTHEIQACLGRLAGNSDTHPRQQCTASSDAALLDYALAHLVGTHVLVPWQYAIPHPYIYHLCMYACMEWAPADKRTAGGACSISPIPRTCPINLPSVDPASPSSIEAEHPLLPNLTLLDDICL